MRTRTKSSLLWLQVLLHRQPAGVRPAGLERLQEAWVVEVGANTSTSAWGMLSAAELQNECRLQQSLCLSYTKKMVKCMPVPVLA